MQATHPRIFKTGSVFGSLQSQPTPLFSSQPLIFKSSFSAMTKIVGTLGPKSRSVEVISNCLKAGMTGWEPMRSLIDILAQRNATSICVTSIYKYKSTKKIEEKCHLENFYFALDKMVTFARKLSDDYLISNITLAKKLIR